MNIVQSIAKKRTAEKRQAITITIKSSTIKKIDDLARQANVSVSYLVGELLEMSVSIGGTIEVVGQELQNFVEKIVAANGTFSSVNAEKSQKKTIKKGSQRKIAKPVLIGGRR